MKQGGQSTSEDDAPPVVSRHPQRTAASAATAASAGSARASASAKHKAEPAASLRGSYGSTVSSRGHSWEQQPLSAWSVADTATWLEDAMQMSEAALLARSVGVDGLLLGVMTDSELHVELGLSSAFQRKKLLVHLDTLRALDTGFPCAAAPPVSRLTGIGNTAYTSGGSARTGLSRSTTVGGEESARLMPSDDAVKVEVEAHRTMEKASISWFGAELARIRATATATRAASRLLLSTLEGKKEVAHSSLQSTQAEIQKQREPIDKVRRPRLVLV